MTTMITTQNKRHKHKLEIERPSEKKCSKLDDKIT